MKADFVSQSQIEHLVNNAHWACISIDGDDQRYPDIMPVAYTKRQGNTLFGSCSEHLSGTQTISGVIMDTEHVQGTGYALYFRGDADFKNGKCQIKMTETSLNGGVLDANHNVWIDERRPIEIDKAASTEHVMNKTPHQWDVKKAIASAKTMINDAPYMILSTRNENGETHTTPVFYAQGYRLDFNWLSTEHAKHSQNIKKNGYISGLILDTRQAPNQAIAFKFSGGAQLHSDCEDQLISFRERAVNRICAESKTLQTKEDFFLSAESPRKPYFVHVLEASMIMNGQKELGLDIITDGARRYINSQQLRMY